MAAAKPMSGPELVARVLVLEAYVIALARESPPSSDLRDEVMQIVESFGRPEMGVHAEIYVNEISKRIGAEAPARNPGFAEQPQDHADVRTEIDGARRES